MTTQVFRTFIVVLGCVGVVLAMSPDVCLAGGSAFVDGSTLKVRVAWSQGDDPVVDVDFSVDFTDELNPKIELIEGDMGWIVSSELLSDGSPANIGELTTTDGDNYGVTLANGANAGAVDVGSMVLVPSGANHSSIAGNIDGDLNGDLTVVKSGGTGGSADGFTIDGDVDGDITIPFADGFTILGEFGVATGDPHTLDVEDITGGDLIINSARNVFITVSVKISAGRLVINENMLDNCLIDIELIEGCISLGAGQSSLEIGNDLTEGAATADVAIIMRNDLASGCKLDLKNAVLTEILNFATHDVDGEIHMYRYSAGLSGFRSISGTLKVTEDLTNGTFKLSSNLQSGGLIDINGDCDGTVRVDGGLYGTVDIDGSLIAGAFNKITVSGTLSSTGKILIGKDCAALVQVVGVMAGDIFIGDDVTLAGNLTSDGEVRMHAAMSGTLDIDGNLAGEVYVGFGGTASLTGDMVIDGDLSGLIDISDDLSGTGCRFDSGCINVSGGSITSTGVIQIDDACTGEIQTGGDLDGDILITGNLSGEITIGDGTTEDIGLGGLIDVNGTFSGTITVADDMAGLGLSLAVIDIAGLASGTIHIKDDFSLFSDIILGDDLRAGGLIDIGGRCRGNITIALDLDGDMRVGEDITRVIDINGSTTGGIKIGTDLVGDIDIAGDAGGGIDVRGDITTIGSIFVGGKLSSTGRFLIGGLCDGAITIAKQTVSLSLIRMTEGLDASGSITINDSRSAFLHANGDIHIGVVDPGDPPLPAVTFDGSIMVKDHSGGTGGDLIGDITVVGCHNVGALDICLCGGDGESNIRITQTDCMNQVVASCVSSCP